MNIYSALYTERPLMEIWPCEIFSKCEVIGWSSVGCRSVGRQYILLLTQISYTPLRYVRNVARSKNNSRIIFAIVDQKVRITQIFHQRSLNHSKSLGCSSPFPVVQQAAGWNTSNITTTPGYYNYNYHGYNQYLQFCLTCQFPSATPGCVGSLEK